jgi:hypothetical protein
LVTITSPDPYVIGSNTTIATDPTITTNGQTDLGTIYRDPFQDGPFSTWAFGTTSSFDIESGFETQFGPSPFEQTAAFKFQNLIIDGDPTVLSGDFGVNQLALIGVDSLTTGKSGGTLSFGGVNLLLLATQNGSINLGANYAFEGIGRMFVYARGAGASLTITSDISTSDEIQLFSEGDANLGASFESNQFRSYNGGNFVFDDGSITAGGISITSVGNASIDNGVLEGALLEISSGGDLNVGQNGEVSLSAAEINLSASGNINFSANVTSTQDGGSGGTFMLMGEGDISLGSSSIIATTDPLGGDFNGAGGRVEIISKDGTISWDGGQIEVSSDEPGHQSGAGGVIILHSDLETGVGINLKNGSLASFLAPSQFDFSGSISLTTRGSDIILSGTDIEADGGEILIANQLPGRLARPSGVESEIRINGGKLVATELDVLSAGDLNIGLGAAVEIDASAITLAAEGNLHLGNFTSSRFVNFSTGNVFLSGNNILVDDALNIEREAGGSSSINISLAAKNNISVAHDIDLATENPSAFFGFGANISVDAGGNLTSENLNLSFTNGEKSTFTGVVGGNISVATGEDLMATSVGVLVDNSQGGLINSGGNINFDIGGLLGLTGNATFAINNQNFGVIDDDVTLSITAADITTAGSFSVSISNGLGDEVENGGQISGNALVAVSADSVMAGDSFQSTIDNMSGSIGGDATVDVNLANLTGLILVADIDNTGGHIGGNATVRLTTAGNINADVAAFAILNGDNGEGPGAIDGDALIDVSAGGNFNTTTLATLIGNQDGGLISKSAKILFDIAGTLTTDGDALFQIEGGFEVARPIAFGAEPLPPDTSINISAVDLDIGGSLTARILSNGSSVRREDVVVHADNDITVTDNLNVDGTVTAGGNISVGDIVSVPLNVSAGNSVFVGNGMFTFAVSAVNDIIIGQPPVGTNGLSQAFGLFANTVEAGGTLNFNNVQEFSSESGSSIGDIGFTPDDMTVTVGSITSTGPTIPFLFSNASDASPDFGNDNPGNGGNISLNLTANGLAVGSENDLNYIAANGGMAAVDSTAGGNGGTVNIIAAGDVTLNDGDNDAPAVTTYTAFIPQGGPFTLGEGGTVNIDASGTITVNSTVQVSSDDLPKVRPNGLTPEGRRSASGGNISLTSSRSGSALAPAVAINVTDSGQLLSLLDSNAPGEGGTIAMLATGSNSDVNVNGEVEADRGTIDVRNNGSGGRVIFGDPATESSVFMRADIIKAGVFGTNGQLIVGNGFLSANSVLKLYAPGSNGEINFVDSVTLNSGSATILAGDTITIQPTRVVTILGNGGPAQIFTNNANYSGFGGSNPDNGTFSGNGANNPLPLDQAPAFDTSRSAIPPNTHQSASGRPRTQIVHGPRPRVQPARPAAKTRPPAVIDVRDSDELLSLIHASTQGGNEQPRGGHMPRTIVGAGADGRNTANRTSAARNQAQVRNNVPASTSRLP